AFEPEQELIVEIGRIVATIGIDDQGSGQRANLQQAMPVAARARQSRRFQGEDGTHLLQRHIGHQGLEILAVVHLRARLSQVGIQLSNLLWWPAQLQVWVLPGILAVLTLLVLSGLLYRSL